MYNKKVSGKAYSPWHLVYCACLGNLAYGLRTRRAQASRRLVNLRPNQAPKPLARNALKPTANAVPIMRCKCNVMNKIPRSQLLQR